MRLIDADAAKNKVRKGMNEDGLDAVGIKICLALINMFDDAEQLPTIEAEPVIHAHWIPQYVSSRGNTDTFSCSECNANSYTTHMVKSCHYKYCRNCGAKMDGKEVTGS